jgi:ketosteroid isomerase-like protein
MSQENVEFVRAFYAALDRGDDSAWELLPPGFILDASRRLIDPEVVRGRDKARAYWDGLLEAFADNRAEPDELLDAGDKVVAFIHVSGEGKASGARVDVHVVHVWTFRDGGPVSGAYFGEDRAAALEAVGLRE